MQISQRFLSSRTLIQILGYSITNSYVADGSLNKLDAPGARAIDFKITPQA
jgi:hypothetical protein